MLNFGVCLFSPKGGFAMLFALGNILIHMLWWGMPVVVGIFCICLVLAGMSNCKDK